VFPTKVRKLPQDFGLIEVVKNLRRDIGGVGVAMERKTGIRASWPLA
jgi:hypothetical protein